MVRLEEYPIPRQRAEDVELARLRADFTGRWEITRSVDHGGTPGAWHAIRHDSSHALQGVSANTSAELRALLTGAER